MEDYYKISLSLSFLGFLKEMRFIEPFLTDYLSSNFQNITLEVINQEIFPIGTYSHVIQLLIIFLITDYLRYKPLIVVLGFSSAGIWGIMLIVNGKLGLQLIEVIYGTFCACEIAYYAYIYAKTDRKYYQKVTSHTRSAILFGRFFSSLSAQLLTYYNISSYRQLNFITFIFQVITAIWSIFFIPSVKTSIYFHRNQAEGSEVKNQNAFGLIRDHFIVSYKNDEVMIWSIFYTISFCLYFQITAYIQVLWLSIADNVLWNPSVEGIVTLLSAFAMLAAGRIQVKYLQKQSTALIVLATTSLINGVLILFAAISNSLGLCYLLYISYGVIYAFSITICAFKISENIVQDSHGLVFGFNTFVGLAFQTLITLTTISYGFKLSPSGQYITYSFIYLILGVGYLIKFLKKHQLY